MMAKQPPDEQQREEGRPDPEELLRRYSLQDEDGDAETSAFPTIPAVHLDSHRRKRGRLRVYLGAVAGSGKTYAMLNEGHRREGRGTVVLVGYLETHKRSQTQAQLGDLEVMPRKQITYR